MLLETHLKQLKEASWVDDSTLEHLIIYHSYQISQWWPLVKDKFDWKRYSRLLCDRCNKWFHIWWDADKFNYEVDSRTLCIRCPDEFDKWWNPSKFDWEGATDRLFLIPDKFDTWFPELLKRPSKYRAHINHLAQHFPERFDEWWRPDLITPATHIGISFFVNLKHKFKEWWKPECILPSTTLLELLVEDYPEYIDDWLEIFMERLDIKDIISVLDGKVPREKWLSCVLEHEDLPDFVRILLKNMTTEDLERYKLSTLLNQSSSDPS